MGNGALPLSSHLDQGTPPVLSFMGTWRPFGGGLAWRVGTVSPTSPARCRRRRCVHARPLRAPYRRKVPYRRPDRPACPALPSRDLLPREGRRDDALRGLGFCQGRLDVEPGL